MYVPTKGTKNNIISIKIGKTQGELTQKSCKILIGYMYKYMLLHNMLYSTCYVTPRYYKILISYNKNASFLNNRSKKTFTFHE